MGGWAQSAGVTEYMDVLHRGKRGGGTSSEFIKHRVSMPKSQVDMISPVIGDTRSSRRQRYSPVRKINFKLEDVAF